jgi:DNA replication factor GINS
MEEEISYKTLRKIQQAEKQSPQITQINKEFFHDITIFLKQLQHRLENEKKPQKQMLLAEESQNIEKIIRNIYEQREKKIVLAAIAKARGGNPGVKFLLPAEKKLFDQLYQTIVSVRKEILFSIDDEKPDDHLKEAATKEENKQSSPQISNEAEQSQPIKKQEEANNNPILRIIKDIPPFIGTDNNTYTLSKGDVLSLPQNMAKMLIKRKVAAPITSSEHQS